MDLDRFRFRCPLMVPTASCFKVNPMLIRHVATLFSCQSTEQVFSLFFNCLELETNQARFNAGWRMILYCNACQHCSDTLSRPYDCKCSGVRILFSAANSQSSLQLKVCPNVDCQHVIHHQASVPKPKSKSDPTSQLSNAKKRMHFFRY